MREVIYTDIASRQPLDEKFYLIGTFSESETEEEDFDHELAHAFYYLDPSYNLWATAEVLAMDPYERNAMHRMLREAGYAEEVLDDEIQAYCSTGLLQGMRKVVSSAAEKKFRDHFLETKEHHFKCKKIRDNRSCAREA